MPAFRRSRAFTLIEVTVVVALVGILAVLASLAYRRWIRSSYLGEAHGMLANIRTAEEAFKAENTGYLKVSSQLTTLYPATMPQGNTVTAWGGPGDNPALWAALNVNPNAPVRFGYAVIADNDGTVALPTTVKNNGVAIDLAAMKGLPWFVATAVCDIDNDSTTPSTTLFAVSGTNTLFVNNEGN
jgi:type IV pilus assembly protein PilA